MKNKAMNQKVLKAISLGLATMMSMTPITALAEELENVDDLGTDEVKAQEEKTEAETMIEDVQTAEKAAGALVAEADEETGTADGVVTEAAKAEAEAVESAEDVIVEAEAGTVEIEVSQEVKDAADELEEVTVGGDDDKENDVEEIICDTEDRLDDAEDALVAQEEATEKADTKVEQIEDITSGFEQEMDEASAKLDEKQEVIENTDSLEEAKEAKEAAENIVDTAEITYEAAKAAVETAETDYTKAVEEAKAAAEKYNEAVADAEGYTEEALNELKAAKDAAEKLEQEAKKAYDDAKLGEVDAAAVAIIEKEKEVQNSELTGSAKWDERDELFCLIVKNYYVPKCMPEGTQVTLSNGADSQDTFKRFDSDYKNYIQANITYPDGTTEVKYLNYKIDKGDSTSLVIFEKTWEEIVTQEAEDAKYVVYDENSKIEHTIYADALEQAIENNEVVKGTDDNYYVKAKNEDGTTVAGSTSVAVDEDTNTVDEESKETTWSVDEDGNIVKTVTGDVTTVTTRENVSLTGGKGYESEEAAKAAAEKEAEGLLEENEELANTDVAVSKDVETATATATATVTYVTTFTTTIDLTGMTNKVSANDSLSEGTRDSLKTISNDAIKDATKYLEDKDCQVLNKEVSNLQVVRTDDKKITTWKPSTWGNEDTYTATSGTLTVTYAKICTDTVKLSLGDKIFGWMSEEEEKQVALEQLKAEGKYVDVFTQNVRILDLNKGLATVKYIQQYKETEEASATDKTGDAAKAAAEKAAEEAATEKMQAEANKQIDKNITNDLSKKVTGQSGKATTTANVVATTAPEVKKELVVDATASDAVDYTYTYSYTGTFDAEKTVVENKVLNTETWQADKMTYVAAVEEVRENILTNANYDAYLKGDQSAIMLAERTDENFLKFKADALNAQAKLDATKAKYAEIQAKANAAEMAVEEAEKQVQNLQDQIKALEKANADLTELETRLDAAKLKFSEAEKEYEELEKKLEEIEKEYEEAEKRLTPAPVPPTVPAPTPAGGETPAPETPAPAGGETPAPETPAPDGGETPAPETPAPVAPEGGETVPAEQNLAEGNQNIVVNPIVPQENNDPEIIEIDDEETPLAPGVDENEDTIEPVQEEVQSANGTNGEEAEEFTTITDENVALAGSAEEMEEAKSRMNWWWLLIVAVLGATGYEMFRRYEKKKSAQKVESK